MPKDTLLDEWIKRAKNHPVLAGLLLVSIGVIGLAAFTGAVGTLVQPLLSSENVHATLEHSARQPAQIERFLMTGTITTKWQGRDL